MTTKLSLFFALILFSFSCSAQSAAVTLTNIITGIQGAALTNVQARLQAQQQPYQSKLTSHVVQDLYSESFKEIKHALRPFGYFKPTIKSKLTHSNNAWQANYQITLGQPLRITHLNVKLLGEANNDSVYQQYLQKFPLQQGQVFNAKTYQQAKQKLFDLASKRGYFKAKLVKAEILINLQKNTCDITLIFNSGVRYRFGAVTFNNNPYKESFLRRFIPFKQGQPYSEKLVQQLEFNLNSGTFFQGVTVKPQIQQAQDLEVPIQVTLTLRKAIQYDLGVGYGTDTGPRALFGINWRRWGRSGAQLSTLLRTSFVQQAFELNYTIPGKNPAQDQYLISATGQKLNANSGQATTGKLQGAYITTVSGWQRTTSINWLLERYNLINEPPANAYLLMPSAQWTKSVSNDTLNPTRGYQINFLTQGSFKHLISSTSFLQTRVDVKWLRSLTRNQRVVLRGSLGWTAIHNINDLPYTLQFFVGGTNSVRGYQYRQFLGRNLTVGSVELQQRIINQWYLVGFYDTGSIDNTFFGPWYRGVGPGVMWQSPVGSIELTVAKALDSQGEPWVIQFSMGPEL